MTGAVVTTAVVWGCVAAVLAIATVIVAGAATVAARKARQLSSRARALVAVANSRRGARGPAGTTGVAGAAGAAGAPGSGAAFEPGHTKFVAIDDWPAGSDPTVYFTTITAALARVLVDNPGVPTADNPWQIMIFPGTYSLDEANPINLLPNVHLFAPSVESVTISPAVSLTASAASGDTLVSLTSIVFAGDVVINTASAHPTPSICMFANCSFHAASDPRAVGGSFSATNDGTADAVLLANCRLFVNGFSANSGAVVSCTRSNLISSSPVTVAVGAIMTMHSGSTLTNTISVDVNGTMALEAMTIDAPLTVSGSLTATNCTFGSTAGIAMDDDGTAVLLGSQFNAAQLGGGGSADRTARFSSTTSATGMSAFTFPTPYVTVPSVILVQRALPATTCFILTGVSTTGFAFTNPAVAVAYDAFVTPFAPVIEA